MADDGGSWLRHIKGPWAALAGVLLGLFVGQFAPTIASPFQSGVDALVGVLSDAAPYIILISILPAVLELFDLGGGGRAPTVAVLLFTFSTIVAGVFAILVVWPIFGLPLSGPQTGGIVDALSLAGERLGTSPPLIAVFWAFGSAIVLHGLRKVARGRDEEGGILGAILYGAEQTIGVFEWIAGPGMGYLGTFLEYALPFILFAVGAFVPAAVDQAEARAIQEGGEALAMDPITLYLGAAGLIAVIATVYLLAVAFIGTRLTGTSLKKGLTRYLPPVYGFAWATASSTATIPINLEAAEEGLETRESTRNFVIPLGATINLDGTMIGAMVITPMVTQAMGIPLSVTQMFAMLVPLVLVTVGAPGIPGGLAFLAPSILATVLGLTGEIATAFIGVWFAIALGLTDQFRTATNSTNNGFLCLVLDWLFDKLGVEREEVDLEGVQTPSSEPEATPDAA